MAMAEKNAPLPSTRKANLSMGEQPSEGLSSRVQWGSGREPREFMEQFDPLKGDW